MSAIPSSGSSSNGVGGAAASTPSSLQSLTPSNFIQFLITEMQNQDPLQPTSSDQLLGQLSQIGQLESSTDLQTSLTGMVQQNQVSAAASMIGKQVQGTDSLNNALSGIVSSVQVTTNGVNLGLDNGSSISMANVTSITNAATSQATEAAASSTVPAPS